MGNCCSDVVRGRAAAGGTAGSVNNAAYAANDAVDNLSLAAATASSLRLSYHFLLQASVNEEVLSKSDPTMLLYARGKNGALEEIGRTEVVLNSLNPTWITKHTFIYHFGVVQILGFRVYDVDTQFHNVDVKGHVDLKKIIGACKNKGGEMCTYCLSPDHWRCSS